MTNRMISKSSTTPIISRSVFLRRELIAKLPDNHTQKHLDMIDQLLLRPDLVPFIFSPSYITKKYRHPNVIKTHNLIKDLYFLEKHLRLIYGGWERAKQRGLNWEKFFRQWRADLRKQTITVTPAEAFASWEHFEQIQFDNHFCQGKWRYVPDLTFKKLTTQKSKYENYDLTKIVNIYADNSIIKNRVFISPKKESFRQIKLRKKKLDKLINQFAPANSVTLKIIDKKYAYFRIPTMNSANIQQLRTLIIPKDIRNTELLIVDLRNNGGGNCLGFWEKIVEIAGVQNDISNFNFDLKFKSNMYSRLMSLAFSLSGFLLDRKNTPDNMFEKLRSKSEIYSKNIQNKNVYMKKFRASKKPIVLLVNRYVASDAEALLVMVSTIKNSIIIGENSSGTCEFVQPGVLFLPNTGLQIMIPRGVNNDIPKGQKRIDGIGFSPDLYLSDTSWDRKSIMNLITGVLSKDEYLLLSENKSF